jgi:hypothetical protein
MVFQLNVNTQLQVCLKCAKAQHRPAIAFSLNDALQGIHHPKSAFGHLRIQTQGISTPYLQSITYGPLPYFFKPIPPSDELQHSNLTGEVVFRLKIEYSYLSIVNRLLLSLSSTAFIPHQSQTLLIVEQLSVSV